jgi:hypothetical protein
MKKMRLTAGLVGSAVAAVAAGLALTGGAGAATPADHSGAISFTSVDENNSPPLDVVTGAIADHGTDRSVGEKYQKVVLSKGTFEVDSEKFNKSFHFTFDQKDCSARGTAHAANLPISHGTGAYAGITGSISITASFVALGVIKNGTCENIEHHSSVSVGSFSGTGHVSY